MEPLELPIAFSKSGFIYTQLDKSDEAYLYEKKHAESGFVTYEVFEHKETFIFEDFDKKILSDRKKVRYPGNEDFGSWAYAITDFEKAEDKFNLLEIL